MATQADTILDALGKGIAERDIEQLRALYSDDIVVWHGSTGQAQGKDENLGMLASVFAISSELQYVDIVRHEFAGGAVQQHRLTGMFDDGCAMPSLAACLVVICSNGKITRIDEYFDSSHFAPVWERIEALSASGQARDR